MKVCSLMANWTVHGISWVLIKFQKQQQKKVLKRGSKIKGKKPILPTGNKCQLCSWVQLGKTRNVSNKLQNYKVGYSIVSIIKPSSQ